MFNDPTARSLWRRYRERVRAALQGLSRRDREDLLEDLDAHVREALHARAETSKTSDRDCVAEVIERLGPPETQFQALSSPQSGDPAHPFGSAPARLRSWSDAVSAGLSYIAALAGGALVAIMAFLRLVTPDAAGVFESAAGQYQVRLLGLGSEAGQQILPVWMALLLVFIGGAGAGWGFQKLRAAASHMTRRTRSRWLSRAPD